MKAIIFDMDGVIVDSEPLHFKVEKEIFEEFSGTFDPEFHKNFIGTPDITMWAAFKEQFNVDANIEHLLELKFDLFIQNLDQVPLIDGLEYLMSILSKEGYSLALASSNGRKVVDNIIEKFKLHRYLDFSISGDEVTNGKPHPEIFLTVAKKFNIKPSECLVIEDSENGVKAAKAAGMKCIGYKNPNSGDHDLSIADLIISNYSELNLETMKNLFS